MLADLDHLYSLLLGVGLAIARMLPFMMLVPAFCFKYLKGPLRYGLVCSLALIPAPSIGAVAVAQGTSLVGLGGLLIKEAVLGVLLGLMMYAPFWMFASIGALVDSQRGALSGGQINPGLGPDATPLGELFQETLIMLVIMTGGLPLLTQVIWDSYLIWPPTAWLPVLDGQGFTYFINQLTITTQHMMLYVAPFIAVLLLIDAGLAIISLYAQQLNVYLLAMPAKSIAGLTFLLVYFPTLQALGIGEILQLLDVRHHLEQLVKQQ